MHHLALEEEGPFSGGEEDHGELQTPVRPQNMLSLALDEPTPTPPADHRGSGAIMKHMIILRVESLRLCMFQPSSPCQD